MAASAQLRCSWLSPLPAPHRTPEAEAGRGRGRGPASRGGGGAEWEEEGAARGTLSQGCLRMRASSLGRLAESGRQGGQLLALPLRKGKLRPGRCLGTPALLGIPGPPLVTLGRVGPRGIKRHRYMHKSPHAFRPPPSPLSTSSREIPSSLRSGSICPHTPGDPFHSSLPLTLSSAAPGVRMHLFLARVFMDPGPLPGQSVLGITELKFNLG